MWETSISLLHGTNIYGFDPSPMPTNVLTQVFNLCAIINQMANRAARCKPKLAAQPIIPRS